jgi:hypothetical protein
MAKGQASATKPTLDSHQARPRGNGRAAIVLGSPPSVAAETRHSLPSRRMACQCHKGTEDLYQTTVQPLPFDVCGPHQVKIAEHLIMAYDD